VEGGTKEGLATSNSGGHKGEKWKLEEKPVGEGLRDAIQKAQNGLGYKRIKENDDPVAGGTLIRKKRG